MVSKGTLIGKATTGSDGKAVFTADLPIGFSYEVKEVQAPEGYVRNTEDVYSFTFSYTNDQEASVTFTHTFANERSTDFMPVRILSTRTARPEFCTMPASGWEP